MEWKSYRLQKPLEEWVEEQRVEASLLAEVQRHRPQAERRLRAGIGASKTNGKSGSGGSGRLTMSAGAVAGQIHERPTPHGFPESGIWAAWVLREPV